jgi:hypothetical protein
MVAIKASVAVVLACVVGTVVSRGPKKDEAPQAVLENDGSCLYPNGTVADFTLNPATDLGYLLMKVGQYAASFPSGLFTGPWTNWSSEKNPLDGLAKLAIIRGSLSKFNLWTNGPPPVPRVCTAKDQVARSADGSCNDLEIAGMGIAGSRFGRNFMPLQAAAQQDPEMMNPNPREISRRLLSRPASSSTSDSKSNKKNNSKKKPSSPGPQVPRVKGTTSLR